MMLLKIVFLFFFCLYDCLIQPISLGLLRSDIMLETKCTDACLSTTSSPYCCFKQIEMNTISSGMGAMSSLITNVHRSAFRVVLKSYGFIYSNNVAYYVAKWREQFMEWNYGFALYTFLILNCYDYYLLLSVFAYFVTFVLYLYLFS